MCAIIKKSFRINDKDIFFQNIEDDFFEYDNITGLIKNCEYLSLFLEKTNCENRYLFKDFTESLIKAIINVFESEIMDIRPYFSELKNNSFAFVRRLINNTVEIYNIFDEKFLDRFRFAIKDKNGNYVKTQPYSILDVEHLVKIDVIDLKSFERHFCKYVELTEATAEDLNYFL